MELRARLSLFHKILRPEGNHAQHAGGSMRMYTALGWQAGSCLRCSPVPFSSRQRLQGSRRATLRVCALSSNDFRPGVCIELDGAPWKVVEFLHVKPGKGAAFVRTKVKNLITGNVVDRTFRGGESVDSATVEKKETQFSYADGDDYVFMDTTTYDETRLKKDDDWAKYLKEGTDVNLLLWKERVISVEPPMTVELEVVDTKPNIKGNTVSGGTKPATLETGATISVPLFVSTGERIKVDTRTNTYLSRAGNSF